MTLKNEICRIADGGMVTGRPAYLIGINESPLAQNIDPADPLGATTRPGSSLYASSGTAGSGVLGTFLFPWTRPNATLYIFNQYATTLFSTDSGGSYLSVKTSLTSDSYGQGAVLNNLAIFALGGTAPFISTAGSTLATLGGSPPTSAKYVDVYSAKCFLAGNTAAPTTIYFSASNNPEDWTAANDAGNIVIQDTGDTINGLQATKRALYVFMRKTTYILTGDSVFNFQIDRLADIGLVSEWGHASDGNGCFMAADDGIYYISGFQVSRISDAIRQTYVAISDKSTIALEIKGEKLFMSYKGAGGAQNDTMMVLAFKRKLSNGRVSGVWSQYPTQPFTAMKTSKTQKLYVTTNASTAQIYEIDTGSVGAAAPFTTTWQTPDLEFDEPDAIKTLNRLYLQFSPPNATMNVSVQPYIDGVSAGSVFSIVVGTTGSYDLSQRAAQGINTIAGRHIALRIQWFSSATLQAYRVVADVRTDGPPRR